MTQINNNFYSSHDKVTNDLLAPPTVSIVLNKEGLLPVSALNQPVRVTFPAWSAVMMGTRYQLLWDLEPVGETKVIEAGTQPGDTLILHIPVEVLTEGKHALSYRLTNPENGTISDAPPSPIQVDITAPGSPILAPILFPPQIEGGLTSDELEGLNNVLPGMIAGYQGMEKGDLIRTYWNRVPGPIVVVTGDDMGLKRVMVNFTRQFLESVGDVEAPVYYSVTDLAGNQSLDSEQVTVKLKLSDIVPLPPPTVKEATGDTLDPVNAPNGATVVVDGSATLRAGDRVFVVWQGPKGYGEKDVIISEAQAGKALEVVFAPKLVVDNAGQVVQVVYGVYRVNGAVQRSTTLRLNILDALPDIPAPRVKEATGDTLDPAHAPNGATVVVEASAGLRAGDRVFVVWQGPKGYGDKDVIISEAQAGKTLEVIFAPHLVSDNTGESVQVVYGVYRVSGPVQRSTTLALKIIARLGVLPAPRMDGVGADGVLDPSLIPESGALVRVSYPGMSVLDNVVVNWRGASSYDTPAQIGGGNELQFIVPKALVVATTGAAAVVTYTVTRAGVATVSAALGLTVRPGLQLDTSPVTLGGKIYLLPGTPDLLPDFPAGTSIQRVASGGPAPYTYQSSNALVAKVDANGLTTVRGNGKATITVSDASGASKSYEVTVTGVIHCIGIGKGTYAQMTTAAAGNGARIPSVTELKEIYITYGSRWPMGNGNYWSSTVAAESLVGMKWYFVKNLVTGMDFKLLHHNASLGVAIR
jgi:hypothetical protein